MKDFTLRVAGTDYCLTALQPGRKRHSRLIRPADHKSNDDLTEEQRIMRLHKLRNFEPFSVVLLECRKSSTRWMWDRKTTEIIGFDLENLSNKPGCLTRIGTGHDYLALKDCNRNSGGEWQNWNIEFVNEYRMQTDWRLIQDGKMVVPRDLVASIRNVVKLGKIQRIKPNEADINRGRRLSEKLEIMSQTKELEDLQWQKIPDSNQGKEPETPNPSPSEITSELTTSSTQSTIPTSSSTATITRPDKRNVKEDGETKASQIGGLTDRQKAEVSALHEAFKVGIETDMSNTLADEIRRVYCEVAATKRRQLIIMSHLSPLLAASTLGSETPCARIKGKGETLLLQQCTHIKVNLTVVNTNCGPQPQFELKEKNYTIGLDGWSIHNFFNVFSPFSFHQCEWQKLILEICKWQFD